MSINEDGSSSHASIPLIINNVEFPLTPIEEESYDDRSDIYTYVETITDSHDYEFLSLHSSSMGDVDIYYGHLPPVDNGIVYEDIGIDPNSFTSKFDNQVCMIITSPNYDDETDICLMYPHLIDWCQKEEPKLDWFENDEDIAEFLGARDGFPFDDHKP